MTGHNEMKARITALAESNKALSERLIVDAGKVSCIFGKPIEEFMSEHDAALARAEKAEAALTRAIGAMDDACDACCVLENSAQIAAKRNMEGPLSELTEAKP